MTPEQLKDEIDFKINEGRGYQDIYDELNKAYPGREIDLVRLIADVPLLSQRQAYEKHRLGMIVVIVVLAVWQLIRISLGAMIGDYSGILWALPVIYLLCILYALARWKRVQIRSAGYLGIVMVLIYGRVLTNGVPAYELLVDMALYGLIGWLGVEIGHKLGGKYKMGSGAQYTDAKGQIRARYTIRFQN